MRVAASSRRWRSVAVGVVIAAAVGVSLASVLWLGATTMPARAIVHASDGSVLELPLDRDGEQEVTTEQGTNVVTVREGAVAVSRADCPNQDCVHQGSISQVGQQIVCLPHELWIEIVAAEGAEGAEGASADSAATDAEAADAPAFDTVGS